MGRRGGCTCLLGLLAGGMAWGMTVRIENRTGSITVRSAASEKVQVRGYSPTRESRADDTKVIREAELVRVVCEPSDGARIDLDVVAPYEVTLEATTTAGSISFTGFLPRVSLTTGRGDVRIAAPWQATRVQVTSTTKPKELSVPASIRSFVESDDEEWNLWRDAEGEITYQMIWVKAASPGRIDLVDIPIPDDSPVKMTWQAPAILATLQREPGVRPAEPDHSRRPSANTGDSPLFVSDVRLVNLLVSVRDRRGRTISGLKPSDFEVREDGVPQTVAFAGAEEIPFNLALLLDLSGSTLQNRPEMKEAARKFVGITRPQDRVAIYALADGMFRVVSPLTTERKSLLQMIDAIPAITGVTPLYAAIALSYAQEFSRLPQQRNALVVISDGIDSELDRRQPRYGIQTPYEVLRDAVPAMPILIYPILLDAPGAVGRAAARRRMQELADISGGRLFPAKSILDLESVYAEVADELSSVYTVAYYPQNQNFDGVWRRVEVSVKRPGAKVRTRGGYYAR